MKKLLTLVLVVVLGVLLLTACNGKSTEEEILPAETITITDANGLADIKKYTGIKYQNFTFVLDTDIDLSSFDVWESIGDSASNAFMGTFNGNGHTISNLAIKGWDSVGNPTENGIGKENVAFNDTSFFSAGLFGYTFKAKIKNVKLTNIDISYYADGDFSYVGGLVGYDVGGSVFSDVEGSGNIRVSNTYKKVRVFNESGEVVQLAQTCDLNLYLGGLVGYSAGSNFENAVSTVSIDNNFYQAYFQTKNNVMPDEEDAVSEDAYVVESFHVTKSPKQVFAGGFAGYLKNCILKNITAENTIDTTAKNVYVGGLVGAAFDSSIERTTVANAQLVPTAVVKNVCGGILGLSDNTKLTDSSIKDSVFDVSHADSGMQTMNGGGIFGYANSLSRTTMVTADNIEMHASNEKAVFGGLGGVMRDANMNNCTATNIDFYYSRGDVESRYNNFAAVLGAIHGNAQLEDCTGSATNWLAQSSVKVPVPNKITCAESNTTTYVNKDGFPVVRLYKEGTTGSYINVHVAKTANEREIRVEILNEENEVLTEAFYTTESAIDKVPTNLAETYLNLYFEDGVGFKTDKNGNPVVVNGLDMTIYKWQSGRPTIINVTVA